MPREEGIPEDVRRKAEECIAFLEEHDDYIVCGHPNPDGDSIGSLVAMCDLLSSMGKKAEGLLFAPIPDRYNFLPGTEGFSIYPRIKTADCGALVCLDLGARTRIKQLLGKLPKKIQILNIDHHVSNKGFGTVNWTKDDISSAGEMVYNIMKVSGRPFSNIITKALYVAILTDTGRLCYRNTRPGTLDACADLLRKGVDPADIFVNLYERSTRARLELLSLALGTIESAFDNTVSWMMLTQDMYSRTGTSPQDTYDFIELVKSIAGTRVALLFREMDDDQVKLSVRTNGSVNANDLCKTFGGGGHRCAAGSVVEGDLPGARDAVLDALKKLMES